MYDLKLKEIDKSIQVLGTQISTNTNENLTSAGIKQTDITTLKSKSTDYLNQALEIQKTTNAKLTNYSKYKL
jgi:hypothetical protein